MNNLETTQLGRTGITVTRLSAGGHFTNGPTAHEDIPRRVAEINHLIDRGITYHDVQWDPEEVAMAEVLKTRSKEITVAWPLHGVTARGGDVTAQYVIDYCNDHRARYGIDHVDILLWIALEIQPETQDKAVGEVRKGFEALKQDGFCDLLGFSCHHSPEMAVRAISSFDNFSVIMFPYGPLNQAAGRELIPLAKSKGIGTAAMKPFWGGAGLFNRVYSGEIEAPELAAYRGSGRPYKAAIRWVLANQDLYCAVPGMHSIQEIDELIAASSEAISDEDNAILELYNEVLKEKSGEGGLGAWS